MVLAGPADTSLHSHGHPNDDNAPSISAGIIEQEGGNPNNCTYRIMCMVLGFGVSLSRST